MKRIKSKKAAICKGGVFALGGLVALSIVMSGGTNNTFAAACNRYATTISEAICMQDMNDSVKASMQLERQYQLKDSRDGKSYYVAKLADGNVWMTQNLDLDLSTRITLTPDDTDISENWTPKRTTYTLIDDWENLSGEPESLDPGDWYWDGEFIHDITFASVDAGRGEAKLGESNVVQSGDVHYHLGNYYNLSATLATNDVATYVEEGAPDQSICPAGWELSDIASGIDGEETKSSRNTVTKSVRRLVYEYYEGEEMINGGTYKDPLYFNLSGYINPVKELEDIGRNGMYWIKFGDSINIIDSGGEQKGSNEKRGEIAAVLPGTFTWVTDNYASVSSAPDIFGFSVRCVAKDRKAEIVEPIEDSDWNWVEGQEYVIASRGKSMLRFSIPLSDFESVAVDEETLTRDRDYTASGTGTVLTFKADYLDTLAVGEHDVTAKFSGGRTVETTLTILDSLDVPNTGVSTNETNAAAISVSVFGVLLGALVIGLLPKLTHKKVDFGK